MRSLGCLALIALAACNKPKDSDTNGGTDTDLDTDTGTPACTAAVSGTTPEDGDTGVYYRGTISVSFTDDASDALIELRDSSGAAVDADVSWSEGNVQAFLSPVLAPSADYTLHVEVCGVSTDTAFQTSDLGTPLAVAPADLVGRTYVFRLSDAKITEPSFLDAVAGSYLTVPLLFGVQAADETSIDFLGGLGDLGDDGSYSQISGQPTWDFPPADFTGAPYFEANADSITIMYGDIAIPVEDFTLSGTFTADGETIAQGYATGFGDSRNMGALVGRDSDPGAICEIAESAGVDCEACSDGEPYCLYIVATEIEAEWEPGLTLTAVE